ncbi:MAG: NifB/NifX family molybdenum-iron cluster-binding protein [Sulfurovaceae bacterium]|jgi:predicted Fe-Mo cluster-binding NifX family protein|nr:NifB/NifX family molybdenum-iron cluster-binding protein [Sulfurovaceae bacterium]
MKIIFPTDENNGYLSKRGAHFGKAKFYTIITLENDQIIDVDTKENPGHNSGACANAVMNIMSLSPDVLIVSGIGGSPASGFAAAGLDVYSDQASPTVQESIAEFIKGNLKKINAQGTCSVH